jgi:hypothetical protein
MSPLPWSWSDPLDLTIFGIVVGAAITVAGLVGQWLWKRWVENRRSLVIRWSQFYRWLNLGQRFYFRAHIRNRTQQERHVAWDQLHGSHSQDVFDESSVERWGPGGLRQRIDPPVVVGPGASVELFFQLQAARLGTSHLTFRLRETSGERFQSYDGGPFVISVEKRTPSLWVSMGADLRDEFVARVLTHALERPVTRNLTHDRIIRFYDFVEGGRMTIMHGALFQSFEGYSRVERVFLLSAAEARGVTITWAAESTPVLGWRRLFFK